jgi:hypothetical protein
VSKPDVDAGSNCEANPQLQLARVAIAGKYTGKTPQSEQ